MTDDLRNALRDLADAGTDLASPVEAFTNNTEARYAHTKRTRRLVIAGVTTAAVLTAGTAAAVSLHLFSGTEKPEFPDRLTLSVTPSAPVSPSAPVGPGTPSSTPSPEAPVAPVSAFPQPDPNAVFPQCGAVLDIPSGEVIVELFTSSPPSPLGPTLQIKAGNISVGRASGQMQSTPSLVAVKDGVVVGTSSSDPTQIPFEMYGDGGVFPTSTGTIATTLCSDPSKPLPQGRYSIWGSQDFSFTSRYTYDSVISGGPDIELTDPLQYRALTQVATLWMDADGQSTANPGLPAGWPQALETETAFQKGNANPETVVWLAIGTAQYESYVDASLIPSRDWLADLGYQSRDIPFDCQPGSAALGVVMRTQESSDYGTAAIFSTREAADAFVALWEPLHGPVAGVVTGYVGCSRSYTDSPGATDTSG